MRKSFSVTPREEHLFGALKGKVLTDIFVNDGANCALFETESLDNPFKREAHFYFAEGECCSRSKFLFCDPIFKKGICEALNKKVGVWKFSRAESIENAEQQDWDDAKDKYYNVTCDGVVIFRLLNESNGYYGGSISYLGQNIENAFWALAPDEKGFCSIFTRKTKNFK